MGSRARKRAPNCAGDKFITVWESSGSTKEAAERLGLGVGSASVRASRMRAQGVPLKHMSGKWGRNPAVPRG